MGQSTVNILNEGFCGDKNAVWVAYRFSRVHQPQWASPAPTQSLQLLHWSHWATFTLSICMFESSQETHANHTEEQLLGKNIHVCGPANGWIPPPPQCMEWMLILANWWMSDVCVESKRGEEDSLWFFLHKRPLITETESTYSHGERSWDKGSCCRWGQRSWGGAPPHWLAASASTGWPRSCSPRRWAVNQAPWQRSESRVPVELNS